MKNRHTVPRTGKRDVLWFRFREKEIPDDRGFAIVTRALRGYGPRIFVSYSFADAPLAQRLESALVTKGFQVRREDETSLFNEKLTEAIPRRMADAEVFVQLLTTTANRSMWIGRELDWMFEQRKAGTGIMFLPVVFDKSTIPEALKDWWFMDIGSGTLTEEALDAIERFCLKSVHLLRLADDDPLSVVDGDLEKILAQIPEDGRRIIVDSDGKLVCWAQETIDFAESIKSEHRDSFLAQEKSRFDRMVKRLKIRDEVVRKLVVEVMREMQTYTNKPITDAKKPMNHFLQIVLSEMVLERAEVAPQGHPLRTVLKDRVDVAQEANTSNHSRGYLNPGLYAWVFGVKGGEDSMCQMDLVAPGFRSVAVQMPRSIFGELADLYTRAPMPFDPRHELLSGTFINYVLPQIAIHAAYNLTDVATVRMDLEQKYAWRLDQYAKMGLA